MPKYIIDRIPCPACGRPRKVKLYSELDVSRDRKLKTDVMKHTLFEEHCSFCKTLIPLEYNTSYIDSSKGIHIIVAKDEEARQRALEELSERKENFVLRRRIVRDTISLSEKALIFDNDMDDRIIEVLKLVLGKVKEDDLTDSDRLIFNIGYTRFGEKQFCFLPVADGIARNQPIPFSEALYMHMELEYMLILERYPKKDIEVDQEWAEDFLAYAAPYIDKADQEMNAQELLIDQYYDIDDDEEKAAFLEDHWEALFRTLLSRWCESHEEKPTLNRLGESYCNSFFNWVGDIEMDLENARADQQLMDWCQDLLTELDFTDDQLEYHNLRRSYMEAMERTRGWTAAEEYLEQWKQEEPDNPYLIGTEIDRHMEHGELDEALALATQYIHMPVTDFYQTWLYDSIENLYHELGMKDQIEDLRRLQMQTLEKFKTW